MRQEPFQYENGILRLTAWEQHGLTAGFTTREHGVSKEAYASLNLGLHVNDEEAAVIENRRRLASRLHFPLHTWICAEQVHDNKIVKTGSMDAGKGVYAYADGISGTDGIYTDESGYLLTSCYADCVPLYFYAPAAGRIGLAHAGWKGTVRDIAGEMLRAWESEGIAPAEIYVAIGPAIGACCYVVDTRVIAAAQQVVKGPVPYKEQAPGQFAVDLKEINRLLCLQAGVQPANILVSSFCTSCEETWFFSHRRDKGKTGRMLSFIGFEEEKQ